MKNFIYEKLEDYISTEEDLLVIVTDGKKTINHKIHNFIKSNEGFKDDKFNKEDLESNIKVTNNFFSRDKYMIIIIGKKFNYNTIKYSDIQDSFSKLINTLETDNDLNKFQDIILNKNKINILLYKEDFLDKGIVWKEVEKAIDKGTRKANKDKYKITILE